MKAGIGRIGGRVIDEAGQPVAGASLRLDELPPYRKVWKGMMSNLPAVTDADGRWSTTSVPPETCPIQAWVRHPEFREGLLRVPLADFFAGKADIVLKGAVAEGIVTDVATGEPIAGARVLVGDRNYGRDLPRTLSGPDGKFRLANLEPGATNLIVMADGHQPQLRGFDASVKPTRLTISLEPGRRFHGRVVDLDGKPIAGAWVSLHALAESGQPRLAHSHRRPRPVRVVRRPLDEFEVQAHKPGFATELSRFKADDAEQVLVMTPSVLVRGEVRDAKTGEKVARFKIQPSTQQARPGLDEFYRGDYWFHEIRSSRPLRLTFRAEGYRPFTTPEIDNHEPFATLNVKLQPLDPGEGGGPTGRVVGLDGKPAAGALVLLVGRLDMGSLIDGSSREPEGGRLYRSGRGDVAVDEGGTFTFDPIEGPFRLAATHPTGYALATGDDLAKSPEIRLIPWARIEGRVDDSVALKPGDWVEAWSARAGSTDPGSDPRGLSRGQDRTRSPVRHRAQSCPRSMGSKSTGSRMERAKGPAWSAASRRRRARRRGSRSARS